jgi:hypothetical protein
MTTITRADLTGRSTVELTVLAAIFNRLLLAAPPLSADWQAAADAAHAIRAERDCRLSRLDAPAELGASVASIAHR